MDKFGKLLRQARKAWGFTGRDMAMKLYGQTGDRYYMDVERGSRCPNRATVRRMAQILGLDYELLAHLLIQRHVDNLTYYFSKEGEDEGIGKRRKLSAKKSEGDDRSGV